MDRGPREQCFGGEEVTLKPRCEAEKEPAKERGWPWDALHTQVKVWSEVECARAGGGRGLEGCIGTHPWDCV